MKYKFILLLVIFAVMIGCPNETSDTSGKDGKDGSSIVWKGTYADSDDEELQNPEYLWAYYNSTDGCSYLWNGTEWTLLSGKKNTTFDIPVVTNYTDLTVDIITYKNAEIRRAGYLTLYFLSEKEDIPYISFSTDVLQMFMNDKYTVSDVDENTVTITVVNTEYNSKAVIDLSDHTCGFDNYDKFFQLSDVYRDITTPSLDYIEITDYANIAGQPIALDWSTQDINMVIIKESDSEYSLAMPLQTFNDIFLSPFGYSIIYNGTYLYYSYMLINYKQVKKHYYANAAVSENRSQALADFCYNEFCLNLDFNYGLKAIHGIESFPDFDTYFLCTDIKDKLKSTDPLIFAGAVKDVCDFYFGDGHSNYQMNSCYLGSGVSVASSHTSEKAKTYSADLKRYHTSRNARYNSSDENKTIPGYEVSEDGKTAIVRFDHFRSNSYNRASVDLWAEELTQDKLDAYVDNLEETYDTIIFIHKVNEMIHNDNNIENVVLDLSCNGGGSCQAAAFVISWMLGECTFNLSNPITGAKWFSTYQVDVNMDGDYDMTTDSVCSKNLFCLISPLSFSCGNMVPAVLKASGRVTILGAASSGGTAVVQNSSTADGTLFRMSSKYVMSIAKNGSNYDIDQGVEPHRYISKTDTFYDIEKITQLLQ